MSATWTCDRNHRWSVAADADTVELPPVCPECGGPGRLLNGNETLPPDDEPFPLPSLADVRVPGYELIEELGRGAMGVVYRAREEKLGRPVALKMILAGGHASAGDRARFKREAEAVAALRHPNIVQIYTVGESSGLPYCALEYIEGGNLADYAGGKPLPPERAAALVDQLARAVHFAHEHGIVHRDLKPANVLLSFVPGPLPLAKPDSKVVLQGTKDKGQGAIPKVADFGLAKKLGRATGPTATGAVLGTPAYMAPEQAGGDGKTVGPAADTYALGAILYELLTGRPPFKAATPLDTILQVVSTEPVAPRAVNPKVPRDLETITLKCLRKDPGKRYASAAELAEDLRRWQAGQPVTARPQGQGERLWRGVRRRRGWLIAAGAAGLTLFLTQALWPPRAPQDRWLKMVPAAPSQNDGILPIESPPTVITAATLEQAHEAVVAVRSTRAGGAAISGAGFMAVEPGIVVTSLPVLGMDHPLTPPPDSVEITIEAGMPDERKLIARLLSVDRTESLACLQVSGVGLPPPLALGRSADVRNGQDIYLAGVPTTATIDQTGKWAKPTSKVRRGAVAGRILTRSGSVKYLQLEGGGEGWPGSAVFNAEGRLVGVILAGAANSVVRFAVPAESVSALLRERVQSLRLGQAVVAGKGSRLPVTARVADPLNRLWKLSLDVIAGDPGWSPRSPEGEPKGLIGEFGRQTFSLTPSPNDRAGPGEDRDFVGELDLPPLPAGKVYWVQPHYRVSRSGQVGGPYTLGDAVQLPDYGPPVEPLPVRLTLNPAAWQTPERRLDLSVHRLMSFDQGGGQDWGEEATFAERVAVVEPAPRQELNLIWRFVNYRLGGDTPGRQRIQTAMDSLKGFGFKAMVRLAADGRAAAIIPDFANIPVADRPPLRSIVLGLTETLRAVNPPVADRDLKPGGSWTAESEFEFPSGQSVSKGTFHLTHTYAGLRDRAGRREGLIEVSGTVTPPAEKDAAGGVVGRTTGAYAIDVLTGQVRLARVESDMILEMDLPGAAKGAPAKTKVGMVLEIRFQRGPMDGPPIPAVMPLPNGRIDFRPFVPLPGTQ